MADDTRVEGLVAPAGLATLDATGPVDIMVGIPALNHARCVARVVDAVATGLAKHFPQQRSLVLVADAGSLDGTLDAIRTWRETAPSAPPVREIRLAGPPRRARAILTVLLAADRLQARACGLVDADLTGLAPASVERLLHPLIEEGMEFVSPRYTRAVSEGTLTTNLLAPMTRALYGKGVQQPLGGCAGLSATLVRRYLQDEIWTNDPAGHAVDLWLSTEALASGAKVAEAHLGRKMVEPAPAHPDLATTVVRVVGPLFSLMERYRPIWEEIRGSAAIPATGGPASLLPDSETPQVTRMVGAFRQGLKDLLPVWEQIMPEDTLGRLYPLGLLAAEEFQFPPPVWARVVSDFALAFHERVLPRDHLLRALTPLYLGRIAAFLLEARGTAQARLPHVLEAISQAFEAEKDLLRDRWR